MTLFDSGGLEFLSCINQFTNLRKFVLKKSSYMVSSAFDSHISFDNPNLVLDFCFQNSELLASDFFNKLSLCNFKQFDIEVKKFYLDQSMLEPFQKFQCLQNSDVFYTFFEQRMLENEPIRLTYYKYCKDKKISVINISSKRLYIN